MTGKKARCKAAKRDETKSRAAPSAAETKPVYGPACPPYMATPSQARPSGEEILPMLMSMISKFDESPLVAEIIAKHEQVQAGRANRREILDLLYNAMCAGNPNYASKEEIFEHFASKEPVSEQVYSDAFAPLYAALRQGSVDAATCGQLVKHAIRTVAPDAPFSANKDADKEN